EKLLRELELERIPCLRVYNKIDLVAEELPPQMVQNGVCITARERTSLADLLQRIEAQLADQAINLDR
ncbi:MAG: hypothetical protein D3923_10855, partial [Candidatus Electrothrix sp. AR3]|nr:hypothetical protein [Candidatus Electrothrix sp. AR3]